MGLLKLQQVSRKQGVLQTQETILTVFIFVIIIVISMTVFFRFQEGSLRNIAREYRLQQLGNRILTFPDSSELVYTEEGIKKNAVDIIKLIALQNLVQRKSSYYKNRFGYMNITIIEVYPTKSNKKCSIGQIGDCGVWEIYSNLPQEGIKSKFRKETPVSLYYSNTGKYTMGLLMIEVYNL